MLNRKSESMYQKAYGTKKRRSIKPRLAITTTKKKDRKVVKLVRPVASQEEVEAPQVSKPIDTDSKQMSRSVKLQSDNKQQPNRTQKYVDMTFQELYEEAVHGSAYLPPDRQRAVQQQVDKNGSIRGWKLLDVDDMARENGSTTAHIYGKNETTTGEGGERLSFALHPSNTYRDRKALTITQIDTQGKHEADLPPVLWYVEARGDVRIGDQVSTASEIVPLQSVWNEEEMRQLWVAPSYTN